MALKDMYRVIRGDSFPRTLEIAFIDDGGNVQTRRFEKKGWEIGGEVKGLRSGDNPDQEAALYMPVDGDLAIGATRILSAGNFLTSDAELLQSGKHPGKINLTDVDNALNLLRYLMDEPTVAIMKHNNPCGVATRQRLSEAYVEADLADRVAAFGGAIVMNRPCDIDTANEIVRRYAEVVAAADFEEGVMGILSKKKDLRVVRIPNMADLGRFAQERYIDLKSLVDGGIVAQLSFVPKMDPSTWQPAETEYKGVIYKVNRQPTEAEIKDMKFGWAVEAAVSSNSVIYVKNGATIGIGTGEQDRVGVAEIARDKAYRKLADRLCFIEYGLPMNDLLLLVYHKEKDISGSYENPKTAELGGKSLGQLYDMRDSVMEIVEGMNGGLNKAVMISDAFFPFRDGADVGLREGVTAILQAGGSNRDYETIQACNEVNAAMMFTGQRSFKH